MRNMPDLSGVVDSGDIYFVDPASIVIGDELLAGQGRTAEEIVEMAISMYVQGQRRAVKCLMGEGGQCVLVHGYVRTMAARMIRAGFTYTDLTKAEVKVKDKKFRIKVVFVLAGES